MIHRRIRARCEYAYFIAVVKEEIASNEDYGENGYKDHRVRCAADLYAGSRCA